MVPASDEHNLALGDDSPEEGAFQYKRCLVCGSARLHYLFSVSSNRVVQCDDCELLLVNPQPSESDFASVQPLENDDVSDSHASRETDACFRILERYYGNHAGRLLQIGRKPHGFLATAAARGFDVLALKGSKDLRHMLEEQVRTASTANMVEGEYDVCLLFNELERSRNPRSLLNHIHHLLRPDGVILVVTNTLRPAARSLETSKFRSDHLFYFRNAALQSLLIDCGFGKIIAAQGTETPAGRVVHLGRKGPIRDRKLLSVVMPVFNEGPTFASAFEKLVAKQIEGLDIEIVIVESNSTDGTREQVLKYRDHSGIKVVLEDSPRGKGRAVRTGFDHITGDFVLIQDADLEYDLEDYEALLEPLRRNRAAFVLGARHGGSAWKMRQFNDQPIVAAILNFAHWFFTTLINVGFGARLKDPFTMYKVFRRDCLYGIRFECNRFDFDWEIVINFLRKGYRPLEIPVNYRSRSFAEGKKVSFFRDPLTWFRVFLKLRFSRFDPLREIERQRREKPQQEADDPRQAELAQ